MINPVYYVGIDPGHIGGIGILDSRGQFVAAHRWDKRAPVKLYNILLLFKGMIDNIYLEMINAHPGEGVGHVTRNQSLFVNFGIWQGWLMAAGLRYLLIHPATWQTAHGLRNWQKRQAKGLPCHSPLTLARERWPDAPLDYQADDGKASGLLLASLALKDHRDGIDRAGLITKAEADRIKAKKKARERAKQKELSL